MNDGKDPTSDVKKGAQSHNSNHSTGGHLNDRLAEMTWLEVKEAVTGGATTVILPLGATEQHGPHLPLNTDTVRAAYLADQLAARIPAAFVAPPLPFGCSDEHAGFPGLISLNAETLVSLLVDCGRNLAAWGIRRLIILSAHGGNGKALALAAQRLQDEVPELDVWILRSFPHAASAILAEAREADISRETLGLHAGEGETSEMLFIRPDLVRQERAAAGFTGNMTAILPELYEAGLRPVTPNGVLGDPTCAEAARGKRYLDAAIDEFMVQLNRASRT